MKLKQVKNIYWTPLGASDMIAQLIRPLFIRPLTSGREKVSAFIQR